MRRPYSPSFSAAQTPKIAWTYRPRETETLRARTGGICRASALSAPTPIIGQVAGDAVTLPHRRAPGPVTSATPAAARTMPAIVSGASVSPKPIHAIIAVTGGTR